MEKIILGIDPGTNLMGYGVIKVTDGKAEMITMGVIDLRKFADGYLKLGHIFERVTGIINAYLPDEMAIEAPFFGKNVQTMLKLGVVGPSLGQEAINAGLISFIVAFILVLIYMIFYYGLVPGLVADFALLCNVFFIFSVLASFKAVLTLPGIAGIVLTLGMAVDANVLIYERIREEKRNGSPIKKALTDGYGNALSAIIDSNITTVLTGIILFVFGTGPIKGFATTLIIGVLCSLFTAVFISRLIFDFLSRKKPEMMEALPFCTSATKDFLQNVSFDFIGKSKSFLLGSIVILVVGLASLFTSGLKSGIDFSGGRNYIVRFEQPINTADMASQLRNVFDNVSVITIGESNKVRISTNYKIMETSDNIDDEIESMVYDGVKSYLADGVTKDMFLSRYVRTADGGFAADTEDGSVTYGFAEFPEGGTYNG